MFLGRARRFSAPAAQSFIEQPTIREFIDRGGLNENPSGLPGVTPGNGNITLVQREIDDTAALSAAWMSGTPLFAERSGYAL